MTKVPGLLLFSLPRDLLAQNTDGWYSSSSSRRNEEKAARPCSNKFLMHSSFFQVFFTYTSLLLDGMARNYYFLTTWIRKITQFVVSGSILFLPPYTRGEKKNIWSELELNPGPLASQATALTTRPWPSCKVSFPSVVATFYVWSLR